MIISRLGTCFALLAVLLLAAGERVCSTAKADETITLEQAEVGFGGTYKSGAWTPLRLRLRANQPLQGLLEVVCPDPEGATAAFPLEGGEINLQAGQEFNTHAYFLMGSRRSQISLRMIQEGKTVWSRALTLPEPLSSTSEVVLGLGITPHFEEAISLLRRPDEAPLKSVQIEQAGELPDRWWGYGGVEHIVLLGSAAGLLDDLSPAQIEALRQWTLLGGRMVFSCGEQALARFSPTHPWGQFLPGVVREVGPLRDAVGLANYTRIEFPQLRGLADAKRPQVALLESWSGRVLLDQGGLAAGTPLVVRSAYGAGLITFFAIDLDNPAFAAWPGQPRMLANLLDRDTRTADTASVRTANSLGQLGYTDLTGQLRAALERYPGVTIVNFTAVALLVVVYLLAIGPVEYFAMQHWRLQRWLAWVWFVACTLAFSGLAWFLSAGAHGEGLKLNQLEIVDVDLAQGVVQGTEWLHLYSPRARQGDLKLSVAGDRVSAGPAQGWLTWQGLSGEGLGGLEARQSALAQGAEYRTVSPGPELQLSSLALDTASSKPLAAHWWAPLRLEADDALSTNPYGLLTGELHNPLPLELTECLLIYDEWLYRIERLPPGSRVAVSSLAARNLEAVLTRRTVVDTKDLSTAWDPGSVDTPRIVQMLMFHNAARGSAYTGLSHRFQPQLDWSHLIRNGRAVLVGRVRQPLAKLQITWRGGEQPGEPVAQSWSWVRIAIPVRKQSAVARAETP